MNYGDQFYVDVKVEIKPFWITPPQHAAEQAGRFSTEMRMEALGAELALFIREALESKRTPEEWAEMTHRLRLWGHQREAK